jgi:trehalose synthase
VYERRCAANAAALAEMVRPDDIVILHDPQTAGMLPALRAAADVPLIWRAHIGLDLPNNLAREAWGFLTPYLGEANAYVFSREAFTWEGLDHARVTVISPSIDAFSPKNHAMAFTSVTAVLRAAGLAADHHQPHRAGVRAPRRQRWLRRAAGADGGGERTATRQPAAHAGLALGPSQGSPRRAVRVRRARAGG